MDIGSSGVDVSLRGAGRRRNLAYTRHKNRDGFVAKTLLAMTNQFMRALAPAIPFPSQILSHVRGRLAYAARPHGL